MNRIQHKQSKPYHYRIDLAITGFMISGVALLATDIPFHVIILKLIQFIDNSIDVLKQSILSIFITPLVQMEFSDLIGLLLIASSFGLLLRQIRQRIISNSFDSHTCPVCHNHLHRIHRNRWQLILSKALYLSSGYYHCETCNHSSLYFYEKSPHLNRG